MDQIDQFYSFGSKLNFKISYTAKVTFKSRKKN